MQFVWLIRSDIRTHLIQATGNPEAAYREFAAWWILFAPLEFKNLPYPPANIVRMAMEPVGAIEGITLTRWMALLRPALTEALDDAGYLRWLVLEGIRKYGLFHAIPLDFLDWVRAAAPDVTQDTAVPVSRLMVLARSARGDLKEAFDLSTIQGRESLIAWFYITGARDLDLLGLIGQRDVAQLEETSPYVPQSGAIRITHLMFYWVIAHEGLETRNDWVDEGARGRLRGSVDEASQRNGKLRYLWEIRHGCKSLESPFQGRDSRLNEEKSKRLDSLPFGVNLVGFGMGELGVGEDVRMMARCLEAAGVPFCLINRQTAAWSPWTRQEDFTVIPHFSLEPRYRYTIVAMTGFDTAALHLDRPDIFETTHMIGFWPWELPVWPADWSGVYSLVDEIWASSTYTQSAFEKSSSVPVRWMPMAVTLEDIPNLTRQDFGLPEDAYLYLFVFDFQSFLSRKNPEATIEAFRLAFPGGDENVRLVLKVSNIDRSLPRWQTFLETLKAEPRILLFDRNFRREEIPALMRACDAYVSLHRAEGFGRTLAEALLMERAVVATDFSGNTDFLTHETGYPVPCRMIRVPEGEYPFAEGSLWGDPDIEAAAKMLRHIHENPEEAHQKAIKGKALMQSRHGAHPVGEGVSRRLSELESTKDSVGGVYPA